MKVKEINTEEAIRVFKKAIKMSKQKNSFNLMDSEIDFYDKVIELLQRGEKFEEIIGKFNKYLKRGIPLPVLNAEQSFLLEEITQKWLGINEVIK